MIDGYLFPLRLSANSIMLPLLSLTKPTLLNSFIVIRHANHLMVDTHIIKGIIHIFLLLKLLVVTQSLI